MSRYSSPFVGRRDELRILDDARRALAQSRGSIVFIGGETGIGKSRLVAQFAANAAAGRARNLASAECLQFVQHPFGPMATLLRRLLAASNADAIPARTLQTIAQLLPDHARLAPSLPNAMPPDKGQVFDALAESFILASHKRASILLIEDVHWADQTTLEFLSYFANRISASRLMLVATYRTERAEASKTFDELIASLARADAAELIALRPFSGSEVRSLLQNILRGRKLPDETLREIERRCEGNPFFAEALMRNALERDETTQEVAPIPFSIRASVLAHLALLGGDEREVLAFASVLGRSFDLNLLALALERDVDAVLTVVRKACALEILIEEAGRSVSYRFRHELTREALYEEMLAFDARRVHARIIETLERHESPERFLQELAYHAWEARDPQKTLEYNERAGVAALALQAPSDAVACFERALGVAVSQEDKLRLLERLGTVAHEHGDFARSIERLEEAAAIRLSRMEYDRAAQLVIWIAGDRANQGEGATFAYIERFLARCGDELSVSARDGVLTLAARLASAEHDFAAADRMLSRVEMPHELPARARQNYLIVKLNLYSQRGDVEGWRSVVAEFAPVLAQLPPFIGVGARYTIAQTGIYLGANAEVSEALDEADRLQNEWNFASLGAFGATVRAEYSYLRGRLSDARSCIVRALEQTDAFVTWPLLARIGPLVALAIGDDALGDRCLREDLILEARANIRDVDTALVFGVRGIWLSEHGRKDLGRADLRLALKTLGTPTAECGIALIGAARFLEDGELTAVQALADAARGSSVLPARANASLVGAIVAHRAGHVSEARELAQRASALYHDGEWPLFEAQALVIAGEVARAAAIYERCGAGREVARTSISPSEAEAAGRSPSTTMRLSSREREIADLVRLGMTNAAIAERLVIGVKTVEKHISSIFEKVGVRSRAQLAALIAQDMASRELR